MQGCAWFAAARRSVGAWFASNHGFHREERSDAAIHKCKVGKPKWIASLRSMTGLNLFSASLRAGILNF
jgi:hypothetical protein